MATIGTSNSKRDAAERIRHGMYTISNKLLQKSHRQLKTLCYTHLNKKYVALTCYIQEMDIFITLITTCKPVECGLSICESTDYPRPRVLGPRTIRVRESFQSTGPRIVRVRNCIEASVLTVIQSVAHNTHVVYNEQTALHTFIALTITMLKRKTEMFST